MVKHPGLRVRSITQVAQSVVSDIARGIEEVISLLPFASLVTDISVIGSYARGCAELHSDLDINIDTGTEENRLLAKEKINIQSDEFRKSIQLLHTIEKQFGIHIDLSIQHASMREVQKMAFSLRENRLYGTETRRVDIDPTTRVATERILRPSRSAKLSIGVFDANVGYRQFNPAADDPWISELRTWRGLYGENFLEYGRTQETAHMLRS